MTREDIEKRAEEWVDSYPQLDSCTYTQDDVDMMMRNSFVEGAEWMQEQKQTEVDELHNKVSELTEALDASHVFCEGVSDLMAEKAWGWFCTNLDKFKKEIRLEDAIKLYSQYNQAMKGDED